MCYNYVVHDADPGVHSSQRYDCVRVQSAAHCGGIQTRRRPKADGGQVGVVSVQLPFKCSLYPGFDFVRKLGKAREQCT